MWKDSHESRFILDIVELSLAINFRSVNKESSAEGDFLIQIVGHKGLMEIQEPTTNSLTSFQRQWENKPYFR